MAKKILVTKSKEFTKKSKCAECGMKTIVSNIDNVCNDCAGHIDYEYQKNFENKNKGTQRSPFGMFS